MRTMAIRRQIHVDGVHPSVLVNLISRWVMGSVSLVICDVVDAATDRNVPLEPIIWTPYIFSSCPDDQLCRIHSGVVILCDTEASSGFELPPPKPLESKRSGDDVPLRSSLSPSFSPPLTSNRRRERLTSYQLEGRRAVPVVTVPVLPAHIINLLLMA